MGTLPDTPSQGLIYLQSGISAEFNKCLSDTSHTTADRFLEHLFELFSKSNENARYVEVRPDLAQKFSALQQGGQFGCSSDLMTHLLSLHSRNSKEATSTSASVKQSPEKPTPAIVSAPVGRKSRKSQPKRNPKHQVLIDSHSDDDRVLGEPGNSRIPGESMQPSWRERSVSSEEAEGSTTGDVASSSSVPFDLSVVKQEVMEEEEGEQTREVTRKGGPGDQLSNQRPLCLSLHKPKLAPAADTRRPHLPRPLHDPTTAAAKAADSSPVEMITLQSIRDQDGNDQARNKGLGSGKNSSKPLFQLNWRSSSEPPNNNNHSTPSSRPPPLIRHGSHDNSSFSDGSYLQQDSKSGIQMYTEMTPDREPVDVDSPEERNGYNYVLNSLASDGPDNKSSSRNNSLPSSPMQVPVKYPKSIHYVLSSDEEEPQDLSSYGSQSEEQPQNLSMTKPPKSEGNQSATKAETIKYDSNANAVVVSPQVAQHDKNQFIAQPPPFSVPANLIFNDRRSVNNELMGQPQVFQVPHNSSTGSQDGGMLSPGMIIAAQPPALQLVNVIGGASGMPTQVYVQQQPSIISSKSSLPPAPHLVSAQALASLPALAPAFKQAITSPTDNTDGVTNPNLSPNDEQGSPGSRKRRKKMDDTTPFRDPPETSLPFNGPNKYRFYCDVCDTGFTRRYTFNRHKCKGRVEKHYCQLCDKAYLSKYKLKDHILVKHEGQTVACPDCGKKFSSRSSMEMHKKQQHEGQFSIWCKVCGKGFNHTGHYYGHMNKHTNTKPFWCQQCGKRFYGSSYLHNHKQVCRGGDQHLNYPCSLCDRKFKCELYLKKHMKTHDNIPIIADPSVAKLSDADLAQVGVGLPQEPEEGEIMPENGEIMSPGVGMPGSGMPVFPNGPENSNDSSNISNSGGQLVIDENMNAKMDSGGMPADLSRDTPTQMEITA